MQTPAPASTADRAFFGHPAGLSTLFFTELWERFSYYGMRALLVLFMVAAVDSGGLGLTDEVATAIYGIYTAAVYMLALPGGWIADRLLGAQRSIWIGGCIIALGHFTLAVPSIYAFFFGLIFVASGTGLLKPNISAVVGELYGPDDPRRDGGFTIFYMGINLGAVAGPLVCGALAESQRLGWHWGFAAAGVGMVIGLSQFRRARARLGDAGQHPSLAPGDPARQRGWRQVMIGLGLAAVLLALLISGAWRPDPVRVAQGTTAFIVAVAVAYFGWLFGFGRLDRNEKHRVLVVVVLFLASAMFWSGFEQAGSSLNLFAQRFTLREFGDFLIPASWFQSVNPVLIIVLAPVFAALWSALARRQLDPSTPAKFGLGLVLLGAGFGVMYFAATRVAASGSVLPTWLICTYLLHTMGELALSPVGLSATTRLAPRRYVSQMMGVWFLSSSLGNVLAGLLAGELSGNDVAAMPALYAQVTLTSIGAGLLLLALARPLARLTGRH